MHTRDTLLPLFLMAVGAMELAAQTTRWSDAFGESTGWNQALHPRTMADVDGDGLTDVVGFAYIGVYVAFSNGTKFDPATLLLAGTYGYGDGWRTDRHIRTMADVNGDGQADIVGFGETDVWVALSVGRRFATPAPWTSQFTSSRGWHILDTPRLLADYDGDGDADIVGFAHGGVTVAESTGTSFLPEAFQHAEFGVAQGWSGDADVRLAADVNGDGHADVVGFGPTDTRVALGTPTGLSTPTRWSVDFGGATGWRDPDYVRTVADVDGDGLADVVGFADAGTWTALSDGAEFADTRIHDRFTRMEGWSATTPRAAADVNGDNLADLIGYGANGTHVAYGQPGNEFEAAVHVACEFGSSDCVEGQAAQRFETDVDGDGSEDLIGFLFDGVHANTTLDGCSRLLSVDRCELHLYVGPATAMSPRATFMLDAGPSGANQPYVLIGTASGTYPGTPLIGGLQISLNHDWFFDFTLMNANSTVAGTSLMNTAGTLDALGHASASYLTNPLVHHGFASQGTTLHWAFTWFDISEQSWKASNWVATKFVW